MTSEEAMEGLRTLSRRFGKPYKGGEINPVWQRLLLCTNDAYVRAVGIMLKRGNRLPDPDYLVAQTEEWEKRLRGEEPQREHPQPRVKLAGEEKDAARLLCQWHSGEIGGREYVERLHRMAEKYGAHEYAETAREHEDFMEKEGETDGEDGDGEAGGAGERSAG